MPHGPAAPLVAAGHPKRAAALPADERRLMIVRATLPLLLKNGEMVTTRQIAEAAGIAEGTIFRVFADKDEVISAALDLALDNAPLERALASIDSSQPFENCVYWAVQILQQRVVDIWRLSSSVGPRFHGPRSATDRRQRCPGEALRSQEGTSHRRTDRGGASAARLHALDDPSDAGRRADLARPWSPSCSSTGSAPGADRADPAAARPTPPLPDKLLAVVGLQAVSTTAALLLPALNAAHHRQRRHPRHDQAYIRTTGVVMIGCTLIQVALLGRRRLLRGQGGDGLRPRSCAARCSTRSPTSRPARSAPSARRR